MCSARVAGDSVKPGVERSEAPGSRSVESEVEPAKRVKAVILRIRLALHLSPANAGLHYF